MELKKEYKAMNCNEKKERINESFELDYQLSLPQYLDDIEKVIKYSIKNVLCDYEINGSSVRIFGKSIISICYINSAGFPFSNIFEEDFIRNIDFKDCDNICFINAAINTKYSNFRLINQRKLDIHSSVNICIDGYCSNRMSVMSSCENVLTKSKEYNILEFKYSALNSIDFDEIVELDSKSSAIKNIVNSFVNTYIDDSKIIKDKMLVKVKSNVSILYLTDSNNYEKLHYSFSASKIIDVPSCDENDKSIINSNISDIYIKTKSDENGDLNSFEIIGRITVDFVIAGISDVNVTEDAYIPTYPSDVSSNNIKLMTNPNYYYDDKTLELGFDIDENLVEIIDYNAEISNIRFNNGMIVFITSFRAFYYNDKSELCYFDKSCDCSIELGNSDMSFEGNLVLKDYDFSMNASNKLNLRINVLYTAFMFKAEGINYISDIECGENKIEDLPELTLYFAKRNEEVWDIAKKFSTDYNLIIRDNELSGDILTQDRVLLVSGV